jgi:hypothetical protein
VNAARGAFMALTFFAATFTATGAAQAQGFDLTLSARADAWSGTRQLDDARGIARTGLWGRAKVDAGDAGRITADGWLAAQNGSAAPGQQARLRELYWGANAGPFDIRLGRQVIVWGRADGLNPTDNLTPRDYALLVPEDNEQRRGNEWLRVAADTGMGQLSALWAPRAASHTLPLQALSQVQYQVAAAPKRAQWGLKLEMAGDGIDGSLSWFQGDDALPDLALAGASAQGALIDVRNQPLRVLGADMSLARDGVVWRAEAAWSRSGNAGPFDFERKRDRLWLVAGAEWTLPHNTTLGLQISLQQLRGYTSPEQLPNPLQQQVAWQQAAIANQTAARQVGATWRLASRFMNDTLLLETSGVVLNAPHSTLWRTRLSYAISDHWQALAGSEWFSGPNNSLWGQLRRNRVAYAQLRCGW